MGCVVKTSWRFASVNTRWRIEMTGSDTGRALDVIVEPIDGHAKFLCIKSELMLAAKEFVNERPQLHDRCIGRLQRDRAASRPARGEPRHADRYKRQQTAHSHAIALAAETALLKEFGAQRR